MSDPATWAARREQMVREQLTARDIRDPRVLEAMGQVPREVFVSKSLQGLAYADQPLPIGFDQTISQPLVVAMTLELVAVEPDSIVLDVGAGSGYQTAVLARLAKRVYGLEILKELAFSAQARLDQLGIENAEIHLSDGGLGLPERAPFDVIVVAAGAPEIPAPLLEQLADGGRLVMPVGDMHRQKLVRVIRDKERYTRQSYGLVRFVAFTGEHGARKPS